MKRFRFPLRPVAVLRAHRQARAQEVFAKAVHTYVEAEQKHAAALARRVELEALMHDGRRATFRATDEIAFWGAYRRACAEELTDERAVIETRAAMELRREDYLAAHRAVKVVEKLEQKARAIYRRLTGRAELAEMDELAGFRTARRQAALHSP